MFCGKCGAQVPDGSGVCPNCGAAMAPKAQAPNMNQGAQYQSPQFQNPQGGFPNQGVPAGNAPKKGNGKLIGIIAACVVVVALIIFCVVKFAGGSGPKGTYTNGIITIKFEGGRMSLIEEESEISFKYKMKKKNIIVDIESATVSDNFWEYIAEEYGVDEDDLEDTLEDNADYDDLSEALYKAYTDDDGEALGEYLVKETPFDDKLEYNQKKNYIEMDSGTILFYAENYKKGPSGKYTNKEDDDKTLSFKNGKATYDDDGDDEEFTYYCYVDKKDNVFVVFYGEDFYDSDFWKDHYTSEFEYNTKKDKFEIGDAEYKK